MTQNKTTQWFFAFAALASISVVTVQGMLGSPQTALAKMADEGRGGKKVVVTDEDDSVRAKLSKLVRMLGTHTVCTIGQEELDKLSAKYQVSKEDVTVKGQVVTVAKISGYKVKTKDIRQFLEAETGTKLQCKVVKWNNWIYLLFSAQMS